MLRRRKGSFVLVSWLKLAAILQLTHPCKLLEHTFYFKSSNKRNNVEHVYFFFKCHVQLPPVISGISMFNICVNIYPETIKLSLICNETIVLFLLSGQIDFGQIVFKQAAIKNLNTKPHCATNRLCFRWGGADVEDHGHTASNTRAHYPAAPALFKVTTTLNCFVCLFKNALLCISSEGVPVQPEQGQSLPQPTSDTKRRLLFHGCVQAEPGHVRWVTGLLAVFAVSSNVRAAPDIHTRCSALSWLLWKYTFSETTVAHFF